MFSEDVGDVVDFMDAIIFKITEAEVVRILWGYLNVGMTFGHLNGISITFGYLNLLDGQPAPPSPPPSVTAPPPAAAAATPAIAAALAEQAKGILKQGILAQLLIVCIVVIGITGARAHVHMQDCRCLAVNPCSDY